VQNPAVVTRSGRSKQLMLTERQPEKNMLTGRAEDSAAEHLRRRAALWRAMASDLICRAALTKDRGNRDRYLMEAAAYQSRARRIESATPTPLASAAD
jgi:hypothetical protein